MIDFEEQVSFMRIAITEDPVDPNSPVADQIRASSEETFDLYNRIITEVGGMLGSDVTEMRRRQIDPDRAAFLIVAASGDDMKVCPHLQSPTPMIVDLAHRRMLCHPCASVAPRLQVDPDDDSCDFCRRAGVQQFWPVITVVGSTMICGEACDSCAERVQLEPAS